MALSEAAASQTARHQLLLALSRHRRVTNASSVVTFEIIGRGLLLATILIGTALFLSLP